MTRTVKTVLTGNDRQGCVCFDDEVHAVGIVAREGNLALDSLYVQKTIRSGLGVNGTGRAVRREALNDAVERAAHEKALADSIPAQRLWLRATDQIAHERACRAVKLADGVVVAVGNTELAIRSERQPARIVKRVTGAGIRDEPTPMAGSGRVFPDAIGVGGTGTESERHDQISIRRHDECLRRPAVEVDSVGPDGAKECPVRVETQHPARLRHLAHIDAVVGVLSESLRICQRQIPIDSARKYAGIDPVRAVDAVGMHLVLKRRGDQHSGCGGEGWAGEY